MSCIIQSKATHNINPRTNDMHTKTTIAEHFNYNVYNYYGHFLEYLNSLVQKITHMYKTISTRGDTEWTIKLSLLMTTPPK